MSVSVEVLGPEERVFPQIIKTLLLDDSAFDRARIRRLSQNTHLMVALSEVDTITALKAAVANEAFDLILIDYRLPQGDGLEVLEYIQKSRLNSDVATIMITGNGDMKTAVTAMRNGCHDFLTKDAMTSEQLRFSMVGAMQSAAEHRNLIRQTAHQKEIIKQGLTAALLDADVQGAVLSLFKHEIRDMIDSRTTVFTAQDHSDLEALLSTLADDDEFIFT
ncbi:response regulator [Sulfitobacter guttiformis]|uniref:Response regulator receiver domain-containing protein n=1 Tax=Sulfitobacter guttiformis TaxID=74349 RepID=A0A420DQ76_9RHOB|nr:response regulator [Sulfitobacter guttiformis]KIN73698.1 Response regulator/GGDEF domain protein [Sulfitobacter guttiformis KCTC 32187]RKE96338.1 response regulator receiver domain-containing protein [Sulfitobacter guttiformis]